MEQRKINVRLILSRMLLLVLVAVMAFTAVSCGGKNEDGETTASTKTFTFKVVPLEGDVRTYTVETAKKTVGEALLDEGLISGTKDTYGLYVKVVDGITADYDVNQTYWAFYIGDEYAMTGVDSTPVEDGATYAFKVEGGS